MRTLYLECSAGAAGDMLAAALAELAGAAEEFEREMNSLGIPGTEFRLERGESRGIAGTRAIVTVNGEEEDSPADHAHGHEHEHEHGHSHPHEHGHDHEHNHPHEHRTLSDIGRTVDGLNASGSVKRNVMAVYSAIANAEAAVHGKPAGEVHFHEVGAFDAVADIAAVCILMEKLRPDEVVVSPVNVGGGSVTCAHGVLPVPAPATAVLMKGMPVFSSGSEGERCTPTGAALLKHFATSFGKMPPMTVSGTGYGLGKRAFPGVNCVRAFLGERDGGAEDAVLLECNVDDMTAEEIAFATEALLNGGALDVYTESIGMKKSRPGTKICVLCAPGDRDAAVRSLFRLTSTIGVRETALKRYVMERTEETVDTPAGRVRVKTSRGYGAERTKAEYEDLARIAGERGISLAEARKAAGEPPEGKNWKNRKS